MLLSFTEASVIRCRNWTVQGSTHDNTHNDTKHSPHASQHILVKSWWPPRVPKSVPMFIRRSPEIHHGPSRRGKWARVEGLHLCQKQKQILSKSPRDCRTGHRETSSRVFNTTKINPSTSSALNTPRLPQEMSLRVRAAWKPSRCQVSTFLGVEMLHGHTTDSPVIHFLKTGNKWTQESTRE